MVDSIRNELFHPVAIRLVSKCDIIFRIGGAAREADDMIRIGQEKGKRKIYKIEEVE